MALVRSAGASPPDRMVGRQPGTDLPRQLHAGADAVDGLLLLEALLIALQQLLWELLPDVLELKVTELVVVRAQQALAPKDDDALG